MTIDQTYWNKFYNDDNLKNITCSEFCKFIIQYLINNNIKINYILDSGCGNGRDSYELSKYFKTKGIDNSGYLPLDTNNCFFENNNFINVNKDCYDLIYSRFTFHSITNNDQELFLKSINNKNTYLFIETRSDKGINEIRYHGDQHYRNFTNIEYLKNLLIKYNFDILYIEENKDFAIYKDENPYCIRTLCIKK